MWWDAGAMLANLLAAAAAHGLEAQVLTAFADDAVAQLVRAGVDSVEHGHLMNDASIATLKKNGTYLVPTLYLMDWHKEHAATAHLPEYTIKKMQMVSDVGRGERT